MTAADCLFYCHCNACAYFVNYCQTACSSLQHVTVTGAHALLLSTIARMHAVAPNSSVYIVSSEVTLINIWLTMYMLCVISH